MPASVLLTGATGYISGRLLRRFEEGGRAVRCLVRQPARLGATGPATEVLQGDCLAEASLDRALAGVHVAYYLVHSMARGSDFAAVDRCAADNFGRVAARVGVRRIIYLGGLTDDIGSPSAHLRSRAETGEVLRASDVLGRLYWYAMLPIHGLMFRGMLDRIARRGTCGVAGR